MMSEVVARRSISLPALALTLAVLSVAAMSFRAGMISAVVIGAIVLIAIVVALARRAATTHDPGRRRFLLAAGGLGLASLAGGSALGHWVRRLTRPDPQPAVDAMAADLGADALELVRRAYHPGRMGDLQLVLTPGSTSNYAPESLSLVRRDPRSSHALPWMYLERVPIVVYAPGIVGRGDSVDRITLADVAPTAARLIGFEAFRPADGSPLPGVPRPATSPNLVVTFVIDGGGWNLLTMWPEAWPELRRMMSGGITYRNAIVGSFPAVTASAHATIGTGAFPRTHGITGHNIRDGSAVRKAYGEAGHADPSDILVPTLADRWSAAAEGRAWVGEIGYQVWHIGMLGHGGRPLGRVPVGVYFDEDGSSTWRPHNPELYRLPDAVPERSVLDGYVEGYASDPQNRVDERFNPTGNRSVCCTPPIVRYEGDLVEAAIQAEDVGRHGVPDLLFVNYKAPDYAGHTWNMTSRRTADALSAVDRELGRLRRMLEDRLGPGRFAMVVCGDHGQCPTVELMGGVRLDPIQLQLDIDREFGDALGIVESVVPSEVYLDGRALWDAGVTRDDVAAFLRGYRYRDNLGPYVQPSAIDHGRLDERPFAGVLSTDFLDRTVGADLTRFGAGRYVESSDPGGIPPISW